jgi:hypothetical protein
MSDPALSADDPMHRKLNALTTELAGSAPLPPPMPPLRRPSRTVGRGILVAASAFAVIVLVAGATIAVTVALSGRGSPVATSTAAMEAADGVRIAVATGDGTPLGGFLWPGDGRGVLILGAYGEDTAQLVPIATHAHAAGATVALLDPRGQGMSGGDQTPALLVSDIEAAIADLRTRGAEGVMVVGMRHTATAALVAASGPPPGLDSVVAFFPFEQYQGVDAISVVADADVPLTIVGATDPSDLGPWAGTLTRAAPAETTGIILESLPPDAEFMAFFGPDMVRIVLEALSGG